MDHIEIAVVVQVDQQGLPGARAVARQRFEGIVSGAVVARDLEAFRTGIDAARRSSFEVARDKLLGAVAIEVRRGHPAVFDEDAQVGLAFGQWADGDLPPIREVAPDGQVLFNQRRGLFVGKIVERELDFAFRALGADARHDRQGDRRKVRIEQVARIHGAHMAVGRLRIAIDNRGIHRLLGWIGRFEFADVVPSCVGNDR